MLMMLVLTMMVVLVLMMMVVLVGWVVTGHALKLMMVPQESSNLGQWWDSDFCSPLPTVTQYGKECSNS